jgi:dTDP-4-amino-4,6-dideoxygalactose transaminase
VITVANAGGYTTSACRIVAGIPVYVDVRDDSLTLDVEATIQAVTTETVVVVATHLFGNVVDVVALRSRLESINRGDVVIIEDASQAHGASLRGASVGSLGDIGVFSFYPTKNLGALGDAGAIVTSDPELFGRLTALHQYGWVGRYQSELPFGRNSRMDEIQAAVLTVKLPHLGSWNAERRSIVETYIASVSGSSEIVFATDAVAGGVAHLAVARSPQREGLRSHLADLGIGTDVHYPTLDFNQPSQRGLPARRLDLRVSEVAVDEIVSLPCFPGMTDPEVQRVVAALGSFAETAA